MKDRFKRWFRWFLVILVLLVAGAYLLPGHYLVERSVTIQAKARSVFPYLDALKEWPLWTAWTKEMDPTMEMTFSGPEHGVGGIYQWTGQKVGNGLLVLTQSDPDKEVGYLLLFDEGDYVSKGSLTLSESGGATTVKWSNGGKLGMSPINRYFGLLMDAMMGPDFEKGLSNLKRIVEAKK